MYKDKLSAVNLEFGAETLQLDESLPCIVLSDMHLGSGKNDSGIYKSHENFLNDNDFVDFINHYKRITSHHLIINGDFIDFVRIVDIPKSEKDYQDWSAELAKLAKAFQLNR